MNKTKVYKKPNITWEDFMDGVKESTVNDKLSEDIVNTVKVWTDDEGYWEVPSDKIMELKPTDNLKCRYITTDMLARKGGILKKVTNEINEDGDPVQYVTLQNPYLHIAWHVQLENIEFFFVNKVAPRTKKTYDDPVIMAELKKHQDLGKYKNYTAMYKDLKEKGVNISRRYMQEFFVKNNVN